MGGMKRTVLSKSFVTVFGLILCLGIIVVCYNKRINDSINPIEVPYAKVEIKQGMQITEDMVGIKKVPPAMVNATDAIISASQVIDKYANADTTIPKGSIFFERSVVDRDKLPANIILDVPEGYVLYNMRVNTETTYGNSIYPGSYIDIWVKFESVIARNEIQMPVGKLLSNVKVLAVKDKTGQDVFKDQENPSTPELIIFAVPEDYYLLLKKASFLKTYSSVLSLTPTKEKEDGGEVEMTDEQLKNFINNATVWTD